MVFFSSFNVDCCTFSMKYRNIIDKYTGFETQCLGFLNHKYEGFRNDLVLALLRLDTLSDDLTSG